MEIERASGAAYRPRCRRWPLAHGQDQGAYADASRDSSSTEVAANTALDGHRYALLNGWVRSLSRVRRIG
jgi:hypothetical protein